MQYFHLKVSIFRYNQFLFLVLCLLFNLECYQALDKFILSNESKAYFIKHLNLQSNRMNLKYTLTCLRFLKFLYMQNSITSSRKDQLSHLFKELDKWKKVFYSQFPFLRIQSSCIGKLKKMRIYLKLTFRDRTFATTSTT